MKLNEQKASAIHQNSSSRIHSLPKKDASDFNHPTNKHPLYFTVTSSVDEPFIVDWQLSGK